MSNIECPVCKHKFDSDEMYSAYAYDEGEHEVKCPSCKESFHMNVMTCFRYEVLTVEKYFEDGGF